MLSPLRLFFYLHPTGVVWPARWPSDHRRPFPNNVLGRCQDGLETMEARVASTIQPDGPRIAQRRYSRAMVRTNPVLDLTRGRYCYGGSTFVELVSAC
jgi:hypothetical protein